MEKYHHLVSTGSRLGGFAFGLLLAISLNAAEVSENFCQFRGPRGDGHCGARGLPISWGRDRNVRWKKAIPGLGWSSPVIFNGKIYLTTAVPHPAGTATDYSLRAICLRLEDGQIIWDVEVFRQPGASSPRIHSKNSHASPTPVVCSGKIFVHFGHMGTACLDENGSVLWRNDTLRYQPVHGNGGSPVLWEDLLMFSCDGAEDPFVVALSTATGRVAWRTPRDTDAYKKFSFSTPTVIEVGHEPQLISPGSNALCAYDPRSGRELWRVRYDGYSVVPKPVYGHGLLFFSTGYDAPMVMAVRPDGQGDVTDTHVVWTQRRGAPNTPSLLLVDDQLYMVSDHGIFTCLEARTGQIVWQQRLGGNFSASPLYAEGRIYLQSEEGIGYVVAPGRQYRLVAKNDLQERTLASYAAAGENLIIRTADNLYCFRQRGGTQ